MSKLTLICCEDEAAFDACVPELPEQRIVVGKASAFVLVCIGEQVAPDGPLRRAIDEHGWRARSIVGLTSDGAIAVLHLQVAPDHLTTCLAAEHLAKYAAYSTRGEIAWLERLASLPDTRS